MLEHNATVLEELTDLAKEVLPVTSVEEYHLIKLVLVVEPGGYTQAKEGLHQESIHMIIKQN
jgi:hypothetical protein